MTDILQASALRLLRRPRSARLRPIANIINNPMPDLLSHYESTSNNVTPQLKFK